MKTAQEPIKLDEVEQYRIQMAGISTAALGYWKEGDSIHPDYDTPALRDVTKLYAKYDALYKAQAARAWVGLTDEELVSAYMNVGDKEWAIGGMRDATKFASAIEAKLKEKNT